MRNSSYIYRGYYDECGEWLDCQQITFMITFHHSHSIWKVQYILCQGTLGGLHIYKNEISMYDSAEKGSPLVCFAQRHLILINYLGCHVSDHIRCNHIHHQATTLLQHVNVMRDER